MRRSIAVLTAALLMPALLHAGTTTRYWPTLLGGGPCATTLQACIDSAGAGDTVVIGPDTLVGDDGYTAINESPIIRRSLDLQVAPGIDAVFGAGRFIRVQPAAAVVNTIRLSDLVLEHGFIQFDNSSAAAGSSFSIERVRINDLPNQVGVACGIEFQNYGSAGAAQILVSDSLLRARTTGAIAPNGICVSGVDSATPLQIRLLRNRVEAAGGRINVGIGVAGTAGGTVSISGNSLWAAGVGSGRLRSGIALQHPETGALPHSVRIDSNLVVGQGPVPGDSGAGIFVQAAGSELGLHNNSLVFGSIGLQLTGFGAGLPSGVVANNLIAHHSQFGVVLAPGATSNRNNLVWDSTSNSFTPGPNTLTVNPQLVSRFDPRPGPTSPALDAGDNTLLPTGPQFDVDGQPRLQFGMVDIGAHEASSTVSAQVLASAGNTGPNQVELSPFPVTLSPVELLQVTPVRDETQAPQTQNLGVYQSAQAPVRWSLFTQNLSAISLGRRFNVSAPLDSNAFGHASAAANISGATSQITHAALNGRSTAVAVLMHRWDGTYHDRPIGLEYSFAGGGRWRVRNEDGSAMPAGLNFNLQVAPLFSPNAWVARVGGFDSGLLRLSHPLLNDTACAAPQLARVDDPELVGSLTNPSPFALRYLPPTGAGAAGHWAISAEGAGAQFPAGAAFNVIVDGAQVARCRAESQPELFANGFEN